MLQPKTAFCLIACSFVISLAACDGDDSGGGGSSGTSSSGGSSSGGSSSGGSSSGATDDGGAGACSPANTAMDQLHDVDGPLGRPALDGDGICVPGKFNGSEGVERRPY